MSSLLVAVNSALARLGQPAITSLEDTVSGSVPSIVSNIVATLVPSILTEADWNFARTTAKLAKVSGITSKGYLYSFALPTSPQCLKPVQISLDNGDSYYDIDQYLNHNSGPPASKFDIDEKYLLANIEPIWIKYTGLVDVAKWDSSLIEAFVLILAAELAYPLTASSSLAAELYAKGNRKLRKAKFQNALARNITQNNGEVLSVRGVDSDQFLRADMSEEAE